MDLAGKKLEVKDGESLTLGKHVLTFVFAPMVHWPEVMVTYDSTDKVLFAADGFGKFGALDREEHGMTKHAVILSVLSENTVCRYRSS